MTPDESNTFAELAALSNTQLAELAALQSEKIENLTERVNGF